MNKFGGNWTHNKIEILVDYAEAYLTIMHKYAKRYDWRLLYFDGFAGSGFIKPKKNQNNQWQLFGPQAPQMIVGAARRILEIEEPRAFDNYYFVEKGKTNFTNLIQNTKAQFPQKSIQIANTDCNKKIMAMGQFLKTKQGKKYKVLAYIDPCGMQVNWESLVTLAEFSVDAWILIPTGMGLNRMLKKNGKISDSWLEKLEQFLGMDKDKILLHFYEREITPTLFGAQSQVNKTDNAIQKSAVLYKLRLAELFEYVSEPFILRNKTNSIMFHFLMVSNNQTAVNIANDIVKKYNALI